MNGEKMVHFEIWCRSCKHEKEPEDSDPCNECLNHGTNFETTRPVNYIPKTSLTKKKNIVYRMMREGKTIDQISEELNPSPGKQMTIKVTPEPIRTENLSFNESKSQNNSIKERKSKNGKRKVSGENSGMSGEGV